jgi:hypothetical protein
MRDVTSRLYIFSTFQNKYTEVENNKVFDSEKFLWEKEYGLKLLPVYGRYKGQIELSFVIQGDNNLEKIIEERCKAHSQESYLVVYSDRFAELRNLSTGAIEPLGYWREISETVAKGKSSWTKIGDKYFVAE